MVADPSQTTNLPAIQNTESLLERASELDLKAWASPMPARMQARRDRSYAQAVKEFKDAC